MQPARPAVSVIRPWDGCRSQLRSPSIPSWGRHSEEESSIHPQLGLPPSQMKEARRRKLSAPQCGRAGRGGAAKLALTVLYPTIGGRVSMQSNPHLFLAAPESLFSFSELFGRATAKGRRGCGNTQQSWLQRDQQCLRSETGPAQPSPATAPLFHSPSPSRAQNDSPLQAVVKTAKTRPCVTRTI